MKTSSGFSAPGPLLVLVSMTLTLLALEGVLRLTMDPSDLYSPVVTEPDRHQRHNEARFWQRYHDEPEVTFASHDPLLGWDSGAVGRIRDRKEIDASNGLLAVAVGDSFVFGNDVAADENFSAQLARDWQIEVLNMGVPGYGIDQSYLKYRHFGAGHAPDIVLFGIYVPDYARSTVAFTAFAKPQFVAGESTVELTGQPVPHPSAELRRIEGLLTNHWYLPTYVEDLLYRARPPNPGFFAAADRVVGHILEELKSSLPASTRLLVIHIPRGEVFSAPEAVHQEMHHRLLALYERHGIDHIDLEAEFLIGTKDASHVLERYYTIRSSGAAGHLNPAGQRRVAELIAARLDLPGRLPASGSNQYHPARPR